MQLELLINLFCNSSMANKTIYEFFVAVFNDPSDSGLGQVLVTKACNQACNHACNRPWAVTSSLVVARAFGL